MLDLSPRASAPHWSAPYVGRAWSAQFTCWELVRAVQREMFGHELPAVAIGVPDDARKQAIFGLLTHPGWVAVPTISPAGDALDGDVLLMRGADGPHVGVAVRRTAHPAEVLHCIGGLHEGRAWGSVRLDLIESLGTLGYGHLKLWRAAR